MLRRQLRFGKIVTADFFLNKRSNNMEQNKYDSLIFDLDGTLWDAVAAVVQVWNNAMIKAGLEPNMTYEGLSRCMGLRIEAIFDKVIPQATREQRDIVKQNCMSGEQEYLTLNGGLLYDNEENVLEKLKKEYKLFVVSNCEDTYIQAFFTAHNMRRFFDDYECAGRTGKSKAENIKIIAERNGLDNPVYIGDTVLDQQSAKQAGVDFIFAAYGFGYTEEECVSIKSFEALINLLNQKN